MSLKTRRQMLKQRLRTMGTGQQSYIY